MGTVVRLVVGFFFVSVGYDMWASTMSPYWAGSDLWNLFGAGFFWFALAIWVWDLTGEARGLWSALRARRAATN